MRIDYIDAKQILVRNNSPENWFGVHYNMNVYRGCQHECIYCDSRSECYQIESFNDLIVKRNAPVLLDNALASRKKKVTIGTGAMSDPYIPAEKHIRLTEKILNVIIKHKYPFHIFTKSDLILRDIDLLKEINKTFLSVCFTITTCDDDLATKIEPKAPSPTNRLDAIKALSDNGIYCGILFQPILPFILDNEENIADVVNKVTQAGGKYIIPWFAVTMRQGQREYFLEKLQQFSPEIKEMYEEQYHNQYVCKSAKSKKLFKYFETLCHENNIINKMQDIQTYQKLNPYKQVSLFEVIDE